MLKIKIIAVGKDKEPWVSEASGHFIKLLSRYATIEFDIIPSLKNSSSLRPPDIRKKEAELIVREIGEGTIVALADKGKKMDSLTFASWLEKTLTRKSGELKFVIGGPHGLDETVLNKAQTVISLSPLTFSHQIVRLVLLEQLYRAFSILHNTDYHK